MEIFQMKNQKISWKMISCTAKTALLKSVGTVCVHTHHLRTSVYHSLNL